MVTLKENERIDDLQLNGLRLIQNSEMFCFGVDAVLLADYAKASIKKGAKVLDLCCGNGIVPILLTAKSKAEFIYGLEVQTESAKLAEKNVVFNGLDEKIKVICDNLKNSESHFKKAVFDNITCNPPYKENGGGLKNTSDSIMIARHEILCTLEDIIRVSSQLLKPTGKLTLIHRPERLADIIILMKKYKIEPKRLRFVHPKYEKTATMILIEGSRGGRPKLVLDPPLYIYKSDGVYSDEIDRIYGRI